MKSIADVVGASGLAFYAEVALAIFFIVFVAVGLRLLAPSRQWERIASLPLEDDAPVPASRPTHPSPPALP